MIRKCNIRNYSIYFKDGFCSATLNIIGEITRRIWTRWLRTDKTQAWWKLTDPCQEPLETRKRVSGGPAWKRFFTRIEEAYEFTPARLSAINHIEPDGIPVDLGATPSSGISAIAYDNLLQYLPLKDQRNWVYDVVQQVAQPSDEVLDIFGVDTIDLGRTFNTQDSDWYDYALPNGRSSSAAGLVSPARTARWFILGLSRAMKRSPACRRRRFLMTRSCFLLSMVIQRTMGQNLDRSHGQNPLGGLGAQPLGSCQRA